MAELLVHRQIDPGFLAKAVDWIIQFQSAPGAFYEVAPRFADHKMNSTTSWGFNNPIRYRNISLTGHVVIALTIIRDLPGELGLRVAVSRSHAISWLNRNLNLRWTLDTYAGP